jgi:hypothetical protein
MKISDADFYPQALGDDGDFLLNQPNVYELHEMILSGQYDVHAEKHYDLLP